MARQRESRASQPVLSDVRAALFQVKSRFSPDHSDRFPAGPCTDVGGGHISRTASCEVVFLLLIMMMMMMVVLLVHKPARTSSAVFRAASAALKTSVFRRGSSSDLHHSGRVRARACVFIVVRRRALISLFSFLPRTLTHATPPNVAFLTCLGSCTSREAVRVRLVRDVGLGSVVKWRPDGGGGGGGAAGPVYLQNPLPLMLSLMSGCIRLAFSFKHDL